MKLPQSSAAMFLCLVALCLLAIGLLAQSQQSQSSQTHDQSADQHGNHAAHMEHRFDDAERWAKSFDDPARDAWQLPDRVVDALAIRSGQVVADVGAGTGYFTVRLARAAALKVFAVDIEPSMVAYVRKRAAREGIKNVVAVQATSDRTNLPEPVDLVLIVDTYHHIPRRVAYFTELRKLLKPSGRVAIVDFRKGAPEGPPEEFRFTPEQISEELGKAGFVLQKQLDFLPRQNFLVYQTLN